MAKGLSAPFLVLLSWQQRRFLPAAKPAGHRTESVVLVVVVVGGGGGTLLILGTQVH